MNISGYMGSRTRSGGGKAPWPPFSVVACMGMVLVCIPCNGQSCKSSKDLLLPLKTQHPPRLNFLAYMGSYLVLKRQGLRGLLWLAFVNSRSTDEML